MLSPHRAPLKRGTKAGSLLVHQLTAPLPRSGFVLRRIKGVGQSPATVWDGSHLPARSQLGSRPHLVLLVPLEYGRTTVRICGPTLLLGSVSWSAGIL